MFLALVSSVALADNNKGEPRLGLLSAEAVFEFNSATLDDQSVVTLHRLIDQLEKAVEVYAIRIVGHTDSSGPAAYNLQLSEQRATFVATLFRERLPGVRVTIAAAGEGQPLADNENAGGRARNRRLEIQVLASGYPADFQHH